MKKKIVLIVTLCLLFLIGACGEVEESVEVTIPYSHYSYTVGGDWTIDELVEHFNELGFTNIDTDYYTADEYHPREIKEVEINGEDSFDEGDVFNSNDEIEILYYDFSSILTVDSCDDLKNYMSDKTMDYMEFAEEYDGQLVEFDAFVVTADTYMGGTSYIIEVCGGNYDESEKCGNIIRIEVVEAGGSFVNKDVKVGDNVKVVGKVGKRMSEYFDMLWIDASYLDVR